MTTLLLRLFVKDYRHTDAPEVRAAYGILAGVTGIVCNILLFVCKLLAGLLSGSVAVTADAVNNLSDAAGSVVTLLGFRLAERPADEEHPYGHARIEYIAGLAVAALILLVGVELGKSSIEKILTPDAIELSWLTFAILAGSILIKLWMSLFARRLGRAIGSTTLAATAADSRNDMLATAAVLLGCLLGSFFDLRPDGWLGLAVAVFIVCSGCGLARDTISPLLGRKPDPALVERLSSLILSHERVLGIHDLMVHDYGPGQCFASVHAEMNAGDDVLVCHEVLDTIEREALAQLQVHLVIHYDPIVTDDPELNRLHRCVQDAVAAMDPQIDVHDFRMVRGEKSSNLIFDLAVPFAWQNRRAELRSAIEQALGPGYHTVITFDTPGGKERQRGEL